ncbi:hypothetical protein GPECTOR_40g548 [Gonium pectorale]|uniref:C3H1-type domain-containing protein n=1 Tax=Gonium pectorale TaxID=33097 RepID=A0A150GAF5_GONPE|nr:hypothetical protein GPECTOR_40g548 [Gonium pectorale]|eukprot:KXZ46814.1 hypothetical protein GPECTOR_40g548 [Gonium pectorale]
MAESTQVPGSDGMYGSRRSRLQKVETKLSQSLDSEDRRVKELTEGILYDFLPAALNVMLPRCEDPLQELDADRCRAVASAALAVSALMNAPPGFLEFLLCVPWRKLSQLYPKSDSIDKLVSNLQVTDEERRKLVNTRIDPALMNTVLDFLYKEKHLDSVPPMLQLTPINNLQLDDKSVPVVGRETVAAVLDGATPLHCAALRGNPAQVDHLLYCGADPTLKTAAGELPVELVPVCGDRAPGGGASPAARACRCMGPHDQEVWECRSRLARSLIARRCFFCFRVGLFSWLRLVLFCLLCLLGQAGRHITISRPIVERHIDTRRQQKIAAARARAHALVTRMRSEAEAGRTHLTQAKRECMESAAFQRGPPDISQMCFTDPTKSPPPPTLPISQIHDINLHLQESGTSSTGEELASEKAFKCFVRSVHALQSLDLHGETVPQVFAELVQAGSMESRETHVLEDEQADLYSCWAESVLLKFRGCTCPGCATLAIQAVRMAHMQATRLFGKVDRLKQTHAERWQAVGQALARVVYVHICLLLETEAQASPTRSLVFRAETCLREWDRLEKAGLTQGAGVLDPRHVAALQRWAKTADSDLYLAEALHGQSLLPSKTLQEVVISSVTHSPDGLPILARPVNGEVVAALEQAITLASLPSPLLAHIVRSVVNNAVAELAAAARLRELVGSKGAAALGGGGTSEAVAALTEALRAAEPFRERLGPEYDAATELRSKWTQRATAVEKLEGAVEDVRAYASAHPLSFTLAAAAAAAVAQGPRQEGSAAATAAASSRVSGSGSAEAGDSSVGESGGSCTGTARSSADGAPAADLVEWDRRIKQLEQAMNDAKDANVSVTKAKRLLKEMTAIAAAAEASRHLEAVMARRPSGPLQLKLALNRAEAAASSLSGLGGPPTPGLADVLGPLMAAARRRLDTERAAEALSKAAASFRTLADLGRLEAAIYNAKKIGAEELDPESYRTSLELRAQLQEAARVRGVLETALRNLQNQLRTEDAEALERALQDAAKWEDLLAADTAKARKALEQWRCMTVSDAKLARLLREGASTGGLAKAIQEAAASGVKVQHAKRVLKLMQALETALASASGADTGAAERHSLVKSKLDAAEAGGVTTGPLPEAARRMLTRLAATIAREALEAALKPHSDWSINHRVSVLREALERTEGVLGEEDGAASGAADVSERPPSRQLANGTAGSGGKGSGSSRGKRSSGGSSGSGGDVHGGPEDSCASASTASTPSCLASCSTSCSSSGSGSAGGSGLADDEVVVAVRALARKARLVLEEDQAELARIERERQEAERARKEAQERERQERQRQEQERQKREKAEAAERERALADKREKAKAEKARQQQQQKQQQLEQAQQQKSKAAAAEASSASVAGGTERAGGKGSNGKHGQARGANSAAAQAAAAAAGASNGRPGAAAGSGASAAGKTGLQRDAPVLAQAAPPTSAKLADPPAANMFTAPAGPAVAAAAAGAGVRDGAPPAKQRPRPSGGAQAAIATAPCTVVSAAAAIHSRGDSLESLGEVVHKLNKDVIDALDMDSDTVRGLAPGPAGPSPAVGAASGSGGGSTVTPPLGRGSASGGGSFGRSGSGAAATLEGVLDLPPSQRTSSFMSSVASADDVMLHGVGGLGGGAPAGGGLGFGSAPGGAVLGGGPSLSTISTGQASTADGGGSSGGGAAVVAAEAGVRTPPAGAAAGSALGGGGPVSPELGPASSGAAAANSVGSTGATQTAKPRFGFVDLGGASWGLDSPSFGQLSGNAGTGALFPSLQPSGIGDYGAILGGAKPEAANGWPTVTSLGAGTGVGVGIGSMAYGGPLAGQNGGLVGSPEDDAAAALLAAAGRQPGAGMQGPGGAGGAGSGGQAVLGSAGVGSLGGLQILTDESSLGPLMGVSLASPRSSVGAAGAGIQGLLRVRPLGGAGQLAGVTGRSSLTLQASPPSVLASQQNGAGGMGARCGFWTPPSFQSAQGDLGADGGGAAATAAALAGAGPGLGASLQQQQQQAGLHLVLGGGGGVNGLQLVDWPQQLQQQQLGQQQLQELPGGLQLLHLGPGTGTTSSTISGAVGTGAQVLRGAGTAAVSRICRFFLQGYCRDGERCRFAHLGAAPTSPPTGRGGALTAAQLMQLGASAHAQHQMLSQTGGSGTAAAGGGGFGPSMQGGGGPTGGGGLIVANVGQGSAVGSFAFGAPGAEAFAPLGGELHAKAAGRLGMGMGGPAGGSGGASMAGLSAALPVGMSAGGGGSGSGTPGLVGQQQTLQIRDNTTGATFPAILSPVAQIGAGQQALPVAPPGATGAATLQAPQSPQQQQQQLLLSLPDDLTFSPPPAAGPLQGAGAGSKKK